MCWRLIPRWRRPDSMQVLQCWKLLPRRRCELSCNQTRTASTTILTEAPLDGLESVRLLPCCRPRHYHVQEAPSRASQIFNERTIAPSALRARSAAWAARRPRAARRARTTRSQSRSRAPSARLASSKMRMARPNARIARRATTAAKALRRHCRALAARRSPLSRLDR